MAELKNNQEKVTEAVLLLADTVESFEITDVIGLLPDVKRGTISSYLSYYKFGGALKLNHDNKYEIADIEKVKAGPKWASSKKPNGKNGKGETMFEQATPVVVTDADGITTPLGTYVDEEIRNEARKVMREEIREKTFPNGRSSPAPKFNTELNGPVNKGRRLTAVETFEHFLQKGAPEDVMNIWKSQNSRIRGKLTNLWRLFFALPAENITTATAEKTLAKLKLPIRNARRLLVMLLQANLLTRVWSSNGKGRVYTKVKPVVTDESEAAQQLIAQNFFITGWNSKKSQKANVVCPVSKLSEELTKAAEDVIEKEVQGKPIEDDLDIFCRHFQNFHTFFPQVELIQYMKYYIAKRETIPIPVDGKTDDPLL